MGFRELSFRGLGLQGLGITTWLLRLRAGGGGGARSVVSGKDFGFRRRIKIRDSGVRD